LSASQSAATPIGNDVSIVVGSQTIAGWEAVSVTMSAETYPNSFTLRMTEEFSNEPTQILATPGQKCVVKIGADTVITGYVDRYAASVTPNSHEVEISGRGIGEDLVDCSADIRSGAIKGGSVAATSALNLAQLLSQPFGITARSAIADLGKPIPIFQIALGETPYEIIERVARYAGYLVYEDTSGNLVLDRVGTNAHASGFVLGQNIEAAGSTLSFDQRFSTILVVWSTIDQYEGGAEFLMSNNRAEVTDKGVIAAGRTRPRIIVSAQPNQGQDFAQQTANWELARRIGRSQAISVTCDAWRDSGGKLWTPNWLAQVDAPALKLVNKNWIIGSVMFRKDLSGTHADLVLMPPDAFSVQPSTLNLFDQEITGGLPSTQGATPPSIQSGAS
jgi:prophage tail gpP-like protein